jgi:hypothetical protein
MLTGKKKEAHWVMRSDYYRLPLAYAGGSTSAHTAAFSTKAIAVVCLPFAAASMYSSLGVAWACSRLTFAALFMLAMSFLFLRCTSFIRRENPFYLCLDSLGSTEGLVSRPVNQNVGNRFPRGHTLWLYPTWAYICENLMEDLAHTCLTAVLNSVWR